jgi:glycerol-3-phosphate dehydrogenase
MLPFHGRTLVGTTDEACTKENATSPSPEEEAYLLNYVRDWFPQLQHPQVSSRWAGGRPLLKPADQGMDSSRVVREHEVETLACGLVSVMGGKWTTCRPMAEDTLTAVERQLGKALPTPEAMPLRGAAESLEATQDGLRRQKQQLEALLPDTALKASQVAHLQSTYGLEAVALIEPAEPSRREPLSPVIPLCGAELDHSIQREHARSSSDVLARRCRLAMVDLNEAERLRPQVEELLNQAGVAAGSTSPINHQLNP